MKIFILHKKCNIEYKNYLICFCMPSKKELYFEKLPDGKLRCANSYAVNTNRLDFEGEHKFLISHGVTRKEYYEHIHHTRRQVTKKEYYEQTRYTREEINKASKELLLLIRNFLTIND